MDAFFYMLKVAGHSLSRDPNHIAIQAGNTIQAMDASGTPKKSPLSVSTAVLTITPPAGSIKVFLYAVANDIRVSDEATAADHYFVIKAGTSITMDLANEQVFYVLRDSADATLNFLFVII